MIAFPIESRDALSPKEFAALSGLSIATVRRYLADGRWPAVQPGGRRCRVLIPRNALERFFRTAMVSAETPHAASTPAAAFPPAKRAAVQARSGPMPRWLTK